MQFVYICFHFTTSDSPKKVWALSTASSHVVACQPPSEPPPPLHKALKIVAEGGGGTNQGYASHPPEALRVKKNANSIAMRHDNAPKPESPSGFQVGQRGGNVHLGGGFKYFLFSPLLGDDFQFD